MFLGHTNQKLCVSEVSIVIDYCKITEPRKMQLKVEINVKKICNFFGFYKNLN